MISTQQGRKDKNGKGDDWMEDSYIVQLFWERDEQAIEYTTKKYGTYLFKVAHNILNNIEDSEESVNDTYLAAWESMPPHRPEVLSTYLGKLTRRISIDIFRKRNREKRKGSEYTLSLEELQDCIQDSNTPEKEYELQMLSKAINQFLRGQSENARNLFIGRYYFLDALKDVAKYCGMSETKAKMILFRTRRALKEYLEKEGFYI